MPAALVGAITLARRKGDRAHRLLGRAFVVLLFVAGAAALLMPAKVGPVWLGHFGFIHLLVPFVLATATRAIFAIRAGDIRAHKQAMILLYCGAIGVAGFFALLPGRFLWRTAAGFF